MISNSQISVCLLILFCIDFAAAAPEEARIFWTDKDDGQLESSRLDGTDRITLLSNLTDPRGIAIDTANDKIYWASHETNGSIFSANCDGTNVQTFLNSLSEPADLTLDLENRMIYWAEEGANQIRRTSLDSPGTPETVIGGLNRPYYLAIDPAAGFLYWSDFNSTIIHRATIGGESPTNFITGQSRVRDIELTDGMIYWCDRNSNQIRRREITGSGSGTILFSGASDSLDRPHGLVLDPGNNTMYWTDTRTLEVNTAAMDGTGSVTTLVSSSLDGAWGIALSQPSDTPYQVWLKQYFSAAELAAPTNEDLLWGELADPDKDGRLNLLEFAQATNPRSSTPDTDTFKATLVRENESQFFQIVFRLRKDDALSFQVESSATLAIASWNTEQFTELPPRLEDSSNQGYEFITMRSAPLGETNEKLFVRLRVSR